MVSGINLGLMTPAASTNISKQPPALDLEGVKSWSCDEVHQWMLVNGFTDIADRVAFEQKVNFGNSPL